MLATQPLDAAQRQAAGREGTPWAWRPAAAPWFDLQIGAILAWQPGPALGLDASALKREIADGLAQRKSFLRHPCLSAITQPWPAAAAAQDLQMAAWVAAHSTCDLGTIVVPEDSTLWTPAGEEALAAGQLSLVDLGARLREAGSPVQPALDIWGRTVGEPIPETWSTLSPDDLAARQDQLSRDIVRYCGAAQRIRQKLPAMSDWLLSATQVYVPMAGEPGALFRSGSQASLPGVIYGDLHSGDLQILEIFAHETAHLHLHTAAAAAPLIDPNHAGRYSSPLRPEPRPLRGILLAFHALAYICSAMRDARAADFAPEERIASILQDLHTRMEAAEQTLVTHRHHLTEAGNEFLDRTREVGNYGRG